MSTISAKAALSALAAATMVLWCYALSAKDEPGELTAAGIMERNFFVSKLATLQADSTMVLVNHRGQKRERRSTNLVKLQPNGVDSMFLVKFSAPNDIRGTGFLQIEHSDGDDDLWIYLPALKKSRRLVASDKKDSFVGSDFSYGDILLPKVKLYRHTLQPSEAVDGHDCFVVESVPVSDEVRATSGYSRKITWVRKDSFMETRVAYFDLAGRPLKTQTVTGHELLEPATQRWFARQRVMTNHQTGHRTLLRFENVRGGVEAPDETFTLRQLERE